MKSIVNKIIQTFPPEYRKQMSVFDDTVILCKLYQPHDWSWCKLKNEFLGTCALEPLFDGDMDSENSYRTLEIMSGRDKEIGYLYASDLARLLMDTKDHAKRRHPNLNEAVFASYYLKMCLFMKCLTCFMPGYRTLLTEEVIRLLPSLGSTADTCFKQKTVICKFHIPGQWIWYVFEGEFDPEKGYQFFGIMEGDGMEIGHFYLSELLTLIEMGLPVQLDQSISQVPYCTL